jgi:protoporphyrinogen oxidase
MDRRTFILSSFKTLFATALPFFSGCQDYGKKRISFSGSILGPSYEVGHRLLEGNFPAPSREKKVPVVIIGGGISGLSAGWKLHKAGFHEFLIFELEPEVGGVARSGANSITAYPWGAHYVPLPTHESRAVRELFEDLDVIESRTATGHPIYREKYLCFSPQERLFIHGKWQEGILPLLGATQKDLDQFQQFRDIIFRFKHRRGKDGRKPFAIPMEMSSRDTDLLSLDRLSMREFLLKNSLDSTLLHWYVNYACRDDYGCHYGEVSAWAGLHYFCSRDGGEEIDDQTVLTWPEGNGWIVKQLQKKLQSKITTDALVFRLRNKRPEVLVDVYHPKEDASTRIRAREVICACPRIFASRIIDAGSQAATQYLSEFQYSPWLVANLSLKSFPITRSGIPVAWDNVIYDSPSLGYVVATHQSLATHLSKTVLTYYYAMVAQPPVQERTRLLRMSWNDWANFIIRDLSKPHPEIRDLVTHLDIFRWGHAMIQPRVGFIWGSARRQAAQPQGNIYFAHSDLSGFSIFEEAQYRGISAAEKILARNGIPFSSSL